MIRRVCSRLIRIALGLVVVLSLLMLLLIWRLSEEPIPLDLLTPYVETALPSSLAGLQIDVQNVALAWHRQAKRFVLSARDTHLRDAQGIVDASLPSVDVTLNLQTLLRQRAVTLNKVYIDGARIHLQSVVSDAHKPQMTQPGWAIPTSSMVLKALETFIAALESHTLLADIGAVQIVNSAVTLQLPSRKPPLHVPKLDLTLHRTATNISSDLRMTASVAGTDVTFALDTAFDRSTRLLTLKSEFNHLRPSALAALAPALSGLSGISMPFNGSIEFALSPQDLWPSADFDLQGGSGRVTLPGLYRKPRKIKRLTVNGRLNGTNDTLQIKTAAIDLASSKQGRPRLHISGTMKGLSPPSHIASDITMQTFTMADLKQYWPKDVARQPRQWIMKSIPEGLIQQSKAHLVMRPSKASSNKLVVKNIKGSLQYEGLSVHYLRPLPPIRNITGKGQFNRAGFHFQIASGDLENMALTDGQVDITGLDRRAETIVIRSGVTGSLRNALALLGHPHLNLIKHLDMPLETAGGRFHVEPSFAFSLRQAIGLDDVDIHVRGALENVSLQGAILQQDLSNGQLRIELDKHRMTLAGQAELAAIPLSFTRHDILTKSTGNGWRNKMHVTVPRVGHAGRARLGYDLPGVIEGPIAAVIDTQAGWDNTQRVQLQLDLRDTALHLPWLNWQKPIGERASASGTLQLRNNRAVAVKDLRLDTQTLRTRGRAQFNKTGTALVRFDLPHATFGASDLRDVVFQHLDQGLTITVGDSFLDLTPWRQFFGVNRETTPDTGSPEPLATLPVQLNLPLLNRVQTVPGRYLQNVQAHLAWNGKSWSEITASGQVPGRFTRRSNGKPAKATAASKTFEFHYLSRAQQRPNLSLQTNDIGALLRALNVYDNLVGGDVTVTGRMKNKAKGMKTKLQASQFTLQRAPVFAHVLAAASLHGLANLLGNDGLKFDNLNAELTLHSNRVKIKQSHAHGGSLGVTAKGNLTYPSGELDVQGTIIPAYLLNSILGQVPVVNLLVGGKGQGLVAVNYHLSGQVADPNVSVNPISAFTPGFLRGIFGLFKQPKDEDVKPPPTEPEPETPTSEP